MIRGLLAVGAISALGVGGYLAAHEMSTPSTPPVAQAPKLAPIPLPSLWPLPTREGTAAPTPTPTATPLPTPTPAPTPSSEIAAPPWTSADCGAAVQVLREDAALDSAASGRYATGLATPPPGTSGGALGITRFYRDSSLHWTAIADWIATACATGIPPSAAELTAAQGWIAIAIFSHRHDEQVNPANAAWDDQWIGNYDRIDAMLSQVGWRGWR